MNNAKKSPNLRCHKCQRCGVPIHDPIELIDSLCSLCLLLQAIEMNAPSTVKKTWFDRWINKNKKEERHVVD